MILLLREIGGVTAPASGWSKVPHPNDISNSADLLRIKSYRNDIAHAPECSINNYSFSQKWQELSQAVIRVGGPEYNIEVTSLLSAVLDQSHREFYQEFKSLKVDNLMPCGKQTLHERKIGFWSDEDKPFVSTRATKAIQESINQNDVVMVTGPQGSGKSANVHHIALEMKTEGYIIYPVMSIKEIVDFWIPDQKQIFVLDDPFGIHNLDESELNQWEKYQEELKICLQYSLMKILMTVRLHLFQNEKVLGMKKILKERNVNLADKDISLSNDERKKIFCNHASLHNRNDLLKMKTDIENFSVDCFPLVCRIYTADKESKHSVKDFFKSPLSVIEEQISQLKRRDSVKYFCLLLSMIADNKVHFDSFDVEKQGKTTEQLHRDLLEICKLPSSLSRGEMKTNMDTLLNTFFVIEGDAYHFIHDIIHDAVIKHVSTLPQNVLRVTLKHCSSEFRNKRICLQQLTLTFENVDAKIVIGKEMEDIWGDRILRDLKDGYWNDAFSDKCLLTETGTQILATALQKMEKCDIDKLFFHTFVNKNQENLHVLMSSDIPDHLVDSLLYENCPLFLWIVYFDLLSVVSAVMKTLNLRKYRSNILKRSLLMACYLGETDIVRMLIEERLDTNVSDRDDNTLLLIAVRSKNEDIVKILLENRANVNKCNGHGESPLYQGSLQGCDGIVKILLENGADVNKCDDWETSPLYLASRYGNYSTMKVLLDWKAEVDKCNACGTSPLSIAQICDHDRTMELLLQNGAKVNASEVFGESLLCRASRKGDERKVNILLKYGSEVNKEDACGSTPLHIVSEHANESIVNVLLQNGAEVNKQNINGDTPLYRASLHGHCRIARMLLQNGAEVNRCNKAGESPLYETSAAGRDSIVKLLLEFGADINRCDILDKTPLSAAIKYGHDSTMALLMENGAKVNKLK